MYPYSLLSSFWRLLLVLTIRWWPTVSAMHHKEHHYRTQEKQRKGQQSKEVSRMFRDEKEGNHGEKAQQNPGCEPRLKPSVASIVLVHIHFFPPFLIVLR